MGAKKERSKVSKGGSNESKGTKEGIEAKKAKESKERRKEREERGMRGPARGGTWPTRILMASKNLLSPRRMSALK
jgi:hypothetical protein